MKVKDPVCGRTLDIDQAVEPVETKGWLHVFCSQGCQAAFLADPDPHRAGDPRMQGQRSAAQTEEGARHD